ncbi:hypothetical protein GCK72_002286 [Caenorhabditis remanei]|uniref:Uncharacterized protein n=1 Tax=Caenorhabditis remanei TaxID=31234 RepID=A0A6A5HVZ4_CAERE|nr:hypothetical protein GCK72_002286 [Caenorhabditis remanei]KAF1770467.1 hypothetical protein GCK72_002286 [Caenorhabditis remanei]
MPRVKKVQATEAVVMPGNSVDEQASAEPEMASTEAKTSGRGRPAATKGNKRGKTVSIVESEDQEDDEAAEPAPTVKPLSKAAQKKKDLESTAMTSTGATEDVKKGRGRGKKVTVATDEVMEDVPVEEVVAEAVVAPKKGRGRQKKETVVAEEAKEASDAELELAAPREEPVEKSKRGKAKKAAGTENPIVAEEVVVEEKKKRGGRTKVVPIEEESADQPVIQERGNEVEAATTTKKGRGKKAPLENKPNEQSETVPTEENAPAAEEQIVAPSDTKKKSGRGRKPAAAAAGAASALEIDEEDKTDDLPISGAPPANIEVRKARGASRPTTPSLPKSPHTEPVVEGKKGRGRGKKTPVVTPLRDVKEVAKKSARGAAAALSQQDDAEEEHVSEGAVVKNRGGRPKKNVEKPQPEEEAEGESSSTGRAERKRKEGGTQSQIVKKAQKQK